MQAFLRGARLSSLLARGCAPTAATPATLSANASVLVQPNTSMLPFGARGYPTLNQIQRSPRKKKVKLDKTPALAGGTLAGSTNDQTDSHRTNAQGSLCQGVHNGPKEA